MASESGRQKKPPAIVQTLVFPKEKWDNLAAVKKWAKDHKFKTSKVDETSTSWRLRQRPPGEFKPGSFRTICIAGSKDPNSDSCRVKAVVGRLKTAKKSAPWGTSEAAGLIIPEHRIRASGSSLLDRSHLGTRQAAPNGEEFDHRFIASTETLASDGGVILLSAWRLARYQARPRWIAMHDVFGWSGKLTEITLGRAVWAGIQDGLDIDQVGETGRALVVYVRYSDSDFAQEVKLLYEEGGLDDVSVRWDPRTEEVRNPFEEEVQKYGEGATWVAVRVDLVELSAVLLGADQGPNMAGGAQMIRKAVARCRSAGYDLKVVPALVDEIEGLRQKRANDEAALTDSLGLLQQTIDAFDAWLQGSGDIREALGDAVANLAALLSQDKQTGATSGDDDDDRQGGLTVEKLRAAIESLTEAIDRLMATRSADDGKGAGDEGDDAAGETDTEATRAANEQLIEQVDALREKLDEVAELVDNHVHASTEADPPGGGEREGEGDDDPPADAEGGEAGGGEAASEGGGDGGGEEDGGATDEEGRNKSWSEMNDEDEVTLDFEAMEAEASASEAN